MANKKQLKKSESVNNKSEVLTEFPELMTAKEVAAKIRRSPSTLARDRCNGVGIPYLKFGHNVYYRKEDVLTWLAQHQVLAEVKRTMGLSV
jgi:predicted DNA-binding transcriptional regulator YafY